MNGALGPHILPVNFFRAMNRCLTRRVRIPNTCRSRDEIDLRWRLSLPICAHRQRPHRGV